MLIFQLKRWKMEKVTANVTGVRGGPLRCETLALLRQERDEYNRENRTEDQESGSTVILLDAHVAVVDKVEDEDVEIEAVEQTRLLKCIIRL